jgi:hypothetical protein
MLKRYKNGFLDAIREKGFTPTDFVAEEYVDGELPSFRIQFRDTKLFFVARNSPRGFHEFDCLFSGYSPGYPTRGPYPTGEYHGFDSILRRFRAWLARDVLIAMDEEMLPDLWTQVNRLPAVLNAGPSEKHERFGDEERVQVRLALREFRALVSKVFSPSVDEQAVVDDQLTYLADAVDRLSRFDWRGVAINTLISMSVTLSLDTEKGRLLFGLFQQAFAAIGHLLRG